MSSTNLMSSNKERAAASPLVRQYSASMPNIMLLTPAETDEKKILALTKSKSLPAELDVAAPDTCRVDLQSTADAAIKDLQVVITNAAVRPRNRIVSSTVSLNDMDLYLANSRASCYAESRLKKLYFSAPNIMSGTPETANRVPPSATSSPAADDGVENPADRTMELCSDSGQLCVETAGHILCDNNEPAGAGDHEHGDGQSHKSRSFWKRTKKFFRRLLCCTSSPEE
ncbi:unnamed protein product [Macrosiphum euphorbiae]|uniref:Uncharacterized protein n=1 Tax=Macrosiphum euphorbiae TaxID=13131 RepID=A0AAV0VY41_9HEMI|nr:unnamed protein product [Macrosiphum euphorbiae]